MWARHRKVDTYTISCHATYRLTPHGSEGLSLTDVVRFTGENTRLLIPPGIDWQRLLSKNAPSNWWYLVIVYPSMASMLLYKNHKTCRVLRFWTLLQWLLQPSVFGPSKPWESYWRQTKITTWNRESGSKLVRDNYRGIGPFRWWKMGKNARHFHATPTDKMEVS